MVEQLIENSSCRKTLHETILRKIPDLESLSIKLSDHRAGLADLYKIYSAVKEIEKIVEVIGQISKSDNNDILNENFGIPMVKKIDQMDRFQVRPLSLLLLALFLLLSLSVGLTTPSETHCCSSSYTFS